MAGLHIQAGDVASRFLSENSLVPVPCQALSGGSSNPPKFGTLIPNRIFVGGIPSNTTEQELKNFFSTFGQIKDVKIINDRLGASKGSYGFVTFESQEMAEKIIKNESETLIFKDRKLNIGHAIRKQQVLPRTDIPAALFFTGSAMAPYGLQNGMAVYPMSGQDYPLMAQSAASYATMMLSQQNGGAALYLPTAAASTQSAAVPSLASALQQQQQQQQQTHQQAHAQLSNAVNAVAGPGGANNPLAGPNASTSAAAVMAAAAAAMAACAHWPPNNGLATATAQQQQLAAGLSSGLIPTAAVAQQVLQHQSALAALSAPQQQQQQTQHQQQQQAIAATMLAQQQAAWRWSPCPQAQASQQQQQNQPIPTQASAVTSPSAQTHAPSLLPPSCANVVSGGPASVTVTGAQAGLTTMGPGNGSQQNPPAAPLGPTTYLYSPIAGAGHEVMFFHQNSSPYAANSTSDYSTDHSAHSSMLESVEHLSFPCDLTPPGRSSQQLGTPSLYTGHHASDSSVATCLSSYGQVQHIIDPQCPHVRHTHAPHPAHHAQATHLIQPNHSSQPHMITIAQSLGAGPTQPLLSHNPAHAKLYASIPQATIGGNHGVLVASVAPGNNGLLSGIFGSTPLKPELNNSGDIKLESNPQPCSSSPTNISVHPGSVAVKQTTVNNGNGIENTP